MCAVNSSLTPHSFGKSEIRMSKSETISNVQMVKNQKSCLYLVGMIRLKHWSFGFRTCFGFRYSGFEITAAMEDPHNQGRVPSEKEAVFLSRQFVTQLGFKPDHGLRMQLANSGLGHV